MIGAPIHQAVHGYRKGHELLISSTTLPQEDADLVTRLSDLSGSLLKEVEFHPYITGYPLPSGTSYALAKSWLDHSAPRSGCVLTHTLFIPLDQWARSETPSAYEALFSLPSRTALDRYTVRLHPDEIPSMENLSPLPAVPELGHEFISRFFGEGIRPVVWFGERDPEKLAWHILRAIWPRLRAHISWCSFSLQPRRLQRRTFDLMFAPREVYSRFHELPRVHLLGEGIYRGSVPDTSAHTESWQHQWACVVFGNAGAKSSWGRLRNISDLLGEDSTAIRHFYLILDLQNRIAESPTATLGILDAIDHLSTDPSAALAYKREIFSHAIRASERPLPPYERARLLFLISERLNRPSFKELFDDQGQYIASLICAQTKQTPKVSLRIFKQLLQPDGTFEESAFTKGVLLGLHQLALEVPPSLGVLSHFPDLASAIIAREPSLARKYIATGATERSMNDTIAQVTDWVSGVKSYPARKALRTSIIPEIKDDRYSSLLEPLLKDVKGEEVQDLLNVLAESTEGFKSPVVRDLTVHHISGLYGHETRQWAVRYPHWSIGISQVVSGSYTLDSQGFHDIINEHLFSRSQQSQLIASYMRMIHSNQLLHLIYTNANYSAELLKQFLAPGLDITTEASQLLEDLLGHVKDIPVSSIDQIINDIDTFKEFGFYVKLSRLLVRSTLSQFLSGEVTWEEVERLHSKGWALDWFRSASVMDFESIFHPKAGILPRSAIESKERIWRWLAGAPTEFYVRLPSPLPDLITYLLFNDKSGWTETRTLYWVRILNRAARETRGAAHLRLSAQALKFAFDHNRLPLADLVVTAFSVVYRAVTEETVSLPEIDGLFSYFDWDKGKVLRRDLVTSFMSSNWPPGNLALAVKSRLLLRKIFKRVMRSAHGPGYISAILKDLQKRHDTEALKVMRDFQGLVNEPNFYEEWD